MEKTHRIILCTLNAKYIHASLGLRYLLANMKRHGSPDLADETLIVEYTLARQTQQMVEDLLGKLGPVQSDQVQIIGFGVYIWNVLQTTELVRQLKLTRPSIKIVLGGPEVSHEIEQQDIVQLADHVITGWGDVTFPKLCMALVYGPKPLMKVMPGEQPPMDQIELPYVHFSDDDLAHRVLYVEASRGCPFKCEFCLSSLDKTAWAFELEPFLNELDILYKRGARNFKFVDRTFNLKIESSIQILQFFLDRMATDASDNLLVHFEVIPDHLPDRLKAMISQFPLGVLQFEVGIQSFNEEVQKLISRRQDNAQTEANLRWLIEHSNAHLHTDLIFGLPGETIESFAKGFEVEGVGFVFAGANGDFEVVANGAVHEDDALCTRETFVELALHLREVLGFVEQQSISRQAVSAAPTRFLEIRFWRIGYFVMKYKANVWFVNTHTEGVSSYHDLVFVAEPILEHLAPLVGT